MTKNIDLFIVILIISSNWRFSRYFLFHHVTFTSSQNERVFILPEKKAKSEEAEETQEIELGEKLFASKKNIRSLQQQVRLRENKKIKKIVWNDN